MAVAYQERRPPPLRYSRAFPLARSPVARAAMGARAGSSRWTWLRIRAERTSPEWGLGLRVNPIYIYIFDSLYIYI